MPVNCLRNGVIFVEMCGALNRRSRKIQSRHSLPWLSPLKQRLLFATASCMSQIFKININFEIYFYDIRQLHNLLPIMTIFIGVGF